MIIDSMKKYLKPLFLLLLVSVGTLNPKGSSFLTPKPVVRLAAAPASGASYYTDPTRYYEGINDSLVGEELIVALSTLTSTGFISNSYRSLPNIYRYSDVSLSDSSKMRLVYTGTEKSFSPGGMPSGTNKEHVWPASWYGDGKRNEGAGTPGADAHNIWPSASELNSKRGTAAFDELDFATSYKAYEMNRTDWIYGTPGDNDSYVWSTAFDYSNGQNDDVLYPSRGNRGMTARILMYVATRYRNDNRFPVMLHDNPTTLKIGRIGKLSTLLKWHFEEPPTEWEIKRNNEVAARWHHNRNPFVDNPDFAARIYYYLPEPDQSSPTPAVINAIDTYGTGSEKLRLDKTSVTLEVGETIKVNITDNPLNETVTWSSLNPSVATVTNDGTINALAPGQTKIVATGEETSAEVSVKVVPIGGEKIYVDSLSFTNTNETLRVGQSKRLVPTISPADATNKGLVWSSSNNQVATVDESGDVVALNEGSVVITATTSDGSNLSASVTFTINEKSTSTNQGWSLVSDASTLSAGDQLVIASRDHNAVAGSLSGVYLLKVDTTFSSNKEEITTLPAGAMIFTLSGNPGSWVFKTSDNKPLGNSGTNLNNTANTEWTIAINNGNATIAVKTNSNTTLQYNSKDPRFKTYTSNQETPQLYRYTDGESDVIKDAAYDYVSFFMEETAEECAAGNVLAATWGTLRVEYFNLSSEVKDYFYLNSEDDPMIKALVDRYTVIINKYHYDNFLLSSSGEPLVYQERVVKETYDASLTAIIVFISFAAVIVIPLILKKKN